MTMRGLINDCCVDDYILRWMMFGEKMIVPNSELDSSTKFYKISLKTRLIVSSQGSWKTGNKLVITQ